MHGHRRVSHRMTMLLSGDQQRCSILAEPLRISLVPQLQPCTKAQRGTSAAVRTPLQTGSASYRVSSAHGAPAASGWALPRCVTAVCAGRASPCC